MGHLKFKSPYSKISLELLLLLQEIQAVTKIQNHNFTPFVFVLIPFTEFRAEEMTSPPSFCWYFWP